MNVTLLPEAALIDAGANAAVTPFGSPDIVSDADELKPFCATSESASVPVVPFFNVTETVAAAILKVGAGVTVTVDDPLTPPLEAATVYGPPTVAALHTPVDAPMEPPPDVDQVKAGWLLKGLPNWSSAVAVNLSVDPTAILAEARVTEIEVSML